MARATRTGAQFLTKYQASAIIRGWQRAKTFPATPTVIALPEEPTPPLAPEIRAHLPQA